MFPAMTFLAFATAALAKRSGKRSSPWRDEMIETIRLSFPIALTQLGQVAMMTTDLAMIGRLGDAAIAAAALGQIVLFVAFVAGLGIVSAVAPLAAQAFGAREPRMVRRALRVGLWAAVLLGVPLSLVQMHGEALLLLAGQDKQAAALAQEYLFGLGWCIVPAWGYIAIRNFMSAVNRPEPALWVTLAAIPLNAFLAFGLINGVFGLPRLGILGAGVATTIVNVLMCAALIWMCYAMRPFRKYQVLGRFWRFDGAVFAKLLVVGLPISGSFLLEFGLFAGAGLLMGWIGTAALAAHQIAIQVASIIFMVPFGITMAATVRVGQAVGRRDPAAARRSGFAALILAAAFMVTMVIAVTLTRDAIPHLFLNDAAGNAATLALTSTLLGFGTCFFVFDGLQTVALGALRGLNDTRVPLVFAALSFWLVGFASAYHLGFAAGYGAPGIWIGLTMGLVVFATLLVWRFRRLTAHGRLPAGAEIAAVPL
jgi:MATE family multidrug resistance protein